VKPLGMMLVCSALLVAAVAVDNPILLGSIAACALALLLAGPGSKRAYLIFAGTSALLVFLINPFVSVQGLTPIWHGPHIPLLDTEITQEELAFGAGAALRIFASALAVAAFVRIADGDLVLNGVSRVAPRSAMIVALAARLLPTLERDAAGIAVAARARGATASGRRSAADLVSPLVSLSLERSLGLAEAMEARGYGGGPRTREPGPPADGPERVVTAAGVGLCLVTAWLFAFGGGNYLYYDLLGDPVTAAAIGGSAAFAALTAIVIGAVRWPR
jgi:energy-coupling factor transport system permease protein